ncbi:hypothetical protein BH11PSE8_BH11PSE8_07400 [soil metagenome]
MNPTRVSPRARVAEPVSRRKRAARSPKARGTSDAGDVPDQVLAELIRRVRDIEATYRDAAQKMGQLYIYADQNGLTHLTRDLDRPMRNASDNERAMVSILDALQLTASRRQPGSD